jgi:hypothetical protein
MRDDFLLARSTDAVAKTFRVIDSIVDATPRHIVTPAGDA